MGVHGLWKLLEPSGKPVPVETLENHVLAVDVSIWLHQLLQGYRDSGGSSLTNAHLLGLFHRVCKLLFFRIKPVFVFDGGVPTLKKKTIAARHQQKDRATIASEKARQQLLKNLLKQKAVSQVLGELSAIPGTSASKGKKDLYELPAIDEDDYSDIESIHESYSSESEEDVKKKKYKDLHSIDVHSSEFKALPADMRHDILSELKDKRKENSWGRIHEMPEDLGQFSNYQMNRLLKRRSVQVSLEEAEKEMGGRTLSLGDVEALLCEQGIQTSSSVGNRIASDNVTRFLYVTDSAKASEKVAVSDKTKENGDLTQSQTSDSKDNCVDNSLETITDKEKIILVAENESCEDSKIKSVDQINHEITKLPVVDEIKIEESDNSSDDITFEELNEEFEMNRKIIIENSGVTQEQILSIIKEQNKKSNDNVNKIIEKGDSSNYIEKENKGTHSKSDKIIFTDNKSSFENISVPGISEIGSSSLQINVKNSQSKDLSAVNNLKDLRCSDSVEKNVTGISSSNVVNEKSVLSDSDNSNDCDRITKSESEKDNNLNKENCLQIADNKPRSSSDSEDFVLVDHPADKVNFNGKTSKIDSRVLQVTINTDQNANGEDLFADVFDNGSCNENVGLDLKQSTINENNDVEIMNSSDTSSSENEEGDIENSVVNDVSTKAAIESNSDFVLNESSTCDSNSVPDKSSVCKYFESSRAEIETKTEGKEVNTNNGDNDVKDSNESRIITLEGSNSFENDQNSETVDGAQLEPMKKPKKLTNVELSKLQTILEKQEDELLLKQGKEERLASTVTEQMRMEAQELLQLFGVPWVTAPMEAEAQCAFLDSIGLTQGTITDDSDVWLFGARKVYKNFFNQKKFVLQFQDQDIQHFFKLSRGDLVELALLVGSDYTVGVNGIGPVTALEILAMFRPSSSNDSSVLATLTAFKNWLQHPSNSNSPLARKLKDVHLEEGFPNKDVVDAYLHPLVDESDETFTWGFPDLDGLREFTQRKFGWNQARTDEILLPVVKNLSQKTSQSKIDSFFHVKPAIPIYKDKVSQRVQNAIYRLGGESSSVSGLFESAAGSSGQTQRQRMTRGGSQNRRGSRRGRGSAVLEIEPPPPPKPLEYPVNEELIPQRERDRLEALKRKMKAIEVMKAKKSKNYKKRPPKAPIKNEANLSESSSDDNEN